MSTTLEKLTAVSGELISASKKRRRISSVLGKSGFLSLGKGGWLGFRGKDVVSGLLIEGSASDTYISSFVLPIFDELKFVNWSLGRRLVHCSASVSADEECQEAIKSYSSEVFSIRSAESLRSYITNANIDGFYPIWVKYLCLLREHKIDEACEYLDTERIDKLHVSALKKLHAICPAVNDADETRVERTLYKWEQASRLIFGNGEFESQITRFGKIS